MKFELETKSPTEAVISFEATPQEWDQAVDKVYEREKGKYEIQGFRKGKVPRRVIERTYGDSVFFEDAFLEVAGDAYEAALKEKKDINIVGAPDARVKKFTEGKLEGTIKLTVIPPVKLGEYKDLKVEAELIEFDSKMVDEELKNAQAHKATIAPVEKVSEMGDTVVIDFLGSTDGVEFEGGKATDYELKLGSKSFIDTFEEQLCGHKAGEHVTVNVTFPKDYGAPTLAGKAAVFECDIKSVNETKIPALDDEFAKSMGEYKNFEEYRADVEKQIQYEIDHKNATAAEDALIGMIVESSEVVLPDVVINEQLDKIMQDLNYRLAYQGLNISDYAAYAGTTVEKLRAERKKDAERIAKTKQVLEAIVKAEKMRVSEREVEAKIEENAKISNKTLEEYKKTIDERRLDYIYSDILMNKLMDFLNKHNCVVPKQPGAKAEKTAAKKAPKAEEKPSAPAKAKTKTAAKAAGAAKADTKAKPAKKPAKKA